ncbi:class I SAM-dependent methyltransferase [Candidatus Chloroploca sp. Khr17]|uniref:class I SAM-dependent methyltransferase n=1 Tax=Candidatus Chloroploca sp. Khr17 TaxID=2496869 RepID=UPI00101C53FB|nr:class I SAM-dependent methyltransferase [Candidatus Chloroploca sp. Khr17]
MRLEKNGLPANYFKRYDESDDRGFYLYPRLTAHIDEAASAATSQLFRELLPPGGRILDLMSSFVSHMPLEVTYAEVVGLGLNEEEMRNNAQLDACVIHDLNKEPHLPFDDASFDGAVCTVSVQYMTRPIEVFAEMGRVLRPGSPFIVTFSNRCFPSKAVQIWVNTSDAQHSILVRRYFELAGCFDEIVSLDRSPRRWLSDPLYAVVGVTERA